MANTDIPKGIDYNDNKAGLKKSSPLDVQKEDISRDNRLKDRKINDVLNQIEKPEEVEENYKEKLKKLDNDSLEQLLTQNTSKIEEILQKPQIDIKSSLIQAQIDDLNVKIVSSKGREKVKYILQRKSLLKQKTDTLITSKDVELSKKKEKTKHNDNLIASQNAELTVEKSETEEIRKTDKKIEELRGVLLSNPDIKKNKNIQEIEKKFDEIAGTENQKEKQDILDSIIAILKEVGTLESIAKDLDGVGSKKYVIFRDKMIKAEPSLRKDFDRVEMGLAPAIPKIRLGTDDLSNTSFKDGVLTKNEGDLVIESSENGRNISLAGSDYKMDSKLDSDNEEKLKDIGEQANKDLKPINESLNSVFGILDLLQKSENAGADFNEVKQQIKLDYSDLYSELGLENKSSFDDMVLAVISQKNKLEEKKEELIKEAKNRIDELVAKNKKEASEKDENKKKTLQFLNHIGFDYIDQNISNEIIRMINSNGPLGTSLGFTDHIDLEKGELGINKDSNNNNISAKEKQLFARFTNIIISGNEDRPIDIYSVTSTGIPLFKDDNGEDILDRKGYVNRNLSLGITSGKKNIRDYLKNKLVEKDNTKK